MLLFRRLRPSSASTFLQIPTNPSPSHGHQRPRRISALYVTGDKANQTYVALTPYFDFKSRLGDGAADSASAVTALARLQANVRARRADKVDVPELMQLWSVFRDVQLRKVALERQRVRIADTLKTLNKTTDTEHDGVQKADMQRKLKADGSQLREDLKRLKENSYALEDRFVHRYLELPNELHPRTPCHAEPTLLHSRLEPRSGKARSDCNHLNGTEHLIEYNNAYEYYLLDEAAEFEFAASTYFADVFRSAGFVRTSAPDFCRSLLAEAAGLDTEHDLLTVIEDAGTQSDENDTENASLDRTHLTGGGSLVGFLGWCAKLAPFQTALPVRLIGSGRSYVPQPMNSVPMDDQRSLGLYGAVQTTTVQCFQAAADATDAERLFDETVALLAQTYATLGRPLRIVQVPAERLRRAEAMRADVELWSDARAEFVRVGDVRYYGDYLSKRLLFSYKETSTKKTVPTTKQARGEGSSASAPLPKFAYLIGGTVVDVTHLLAVLLENDDESARQFRVPDCMKSQI